MKPSFYKFVALLLPFLFHHPLEAQLEKSLLWEISGNGLAKPSYLYGTMHVGDKRAHDFSDSTMIAFKSTRAYAGELNMAEVDQAALLNMMKLPAGQKLHTLFTDEEWESLVNYCQSKMHVNPNDFDDFNIFFIYSLIAQGQFKNQMGQAVDMYFYNEAKKSQKKLLGLEKPEEQIAAINSMKTDDQKKMVLDAVNGKNGNSGKELKKMLKYYGKGDLEGLLSFSKDAEFSSEFETNLVTHRNHNMAERMEPIMKEQSTFVAVGALHLPGEEGVINLLRQAGYKVRAVKG
ncbi:MAG: TraB/GumN family protein [Bacteroidia bacterium]